MKRGLKKSFCLVLTRGGRLTGDLTALFICLMGFQKKLRQTLTAENTVIRQRAASPSHYTGNANRYSKTFSLRGLSDIGTGCLHSLWHLNLWIHLKCNCTDQQLGLVGSAKAEVCTRDIQRFFLTLIQLINPMKLQ